jgi:uncharacterized protein
MIRLLRSAGLVLALVVTAAALAFGPGSAQAATPKFPALSGRVVDDAHILSPQVQADLTQKLANLEAQTHHQLVVATLSSLQDDTIEDYGYQLGRAWGIGQKGVNDGAILIVAPAEHKVRIEVGYGLEPVLTDALSSLIIQTRIVPKFKAGDIPGGVVDGTDAIIAQLALPDDAAKANVAAAAQPPPVVRHRASPISGIPVLFIILFIFLMIRGGRGGRGGGLASSLPWLLLGSMTGGRGGGWGDGVGGGGGFGGGGGGGFSGGGGGFGGGGSSGGW